MSVVACRLIRLPRRRQGSALHPRLRGERQRDASLWTPFLRCGGELVRQSSLLRLALPAKRTAGRAANTANLFIRSVRGPLAHCLTRAFAVMLCRFRLEIRQDSCGKSSHPDDKFSRHPAHPWFPDRSICEDISIYFSQCLTE